MSSVEWSRAAAMLAHETDAAVIYVEWNFGRDMCVLAISTAWEALQNEGRIPKKKLMPLITQVATALVQPAGPVAGSLILRRGD